MILVLVSLYWLATAIDVVQTASVLHRGIGREANPIMAWLARRVGITAMLTIRAAAGGLLGLVVASGGWREAALVIAVIQWAVVIHNARQLQRRR